MHLGRVQCVHGNNAESGSVQTEAFNRGLQPGDQSVLLEQDDLIAFVEEALKIIHEANEGQAMRQLIIVENPRESWLWDFDFLKLNQWSLGISDDEAWTVDDCISCFWGGVRVKKLRLRTNMLSANQAEAQFDFMKPNH